MYDQILIEAAPPGQITYKSCIISWILTQLFSNLIRDADIHLTRNSSQCLKPPFHVLFLYANTRVLQSTLSFQLNVYKAIAIKI